MADRTEAARKKSSIKLQHLLWQEVAAPMMGIGGGARECGRRKKLEKPRPSSTSRGRGIELRRGRGKRRAEVTSDEGNPEGREH